jgi:hypothetical protein
MLAGMDGAGAHSLFTALLAAFHRSVSPSPPDGPPDEDQADNSSR